MKLTKREKYLLKKQLDYPINRYLMANTCGREDGYEKAERHLEISKIILDFLTCGKKQLDNDNQIEIHDYIADSLTNCLDEVIGFPINEKIYDYDEYVDKFFNVIIDNLDEIKELIKNK